ncbi:clathrin heavy chain linker domain-containing protein 1-like [Oscarella lobularis]|uniref:clathrin heavy chain linker domain-containing protein 1-like n=1 Tax=Oscarella lobularis TaxID=121494 RepID=UPI0033141962
MAVEATSAYNDNMTERKLSFSDVVEKALSGQNFKKSLTHDQTPLSSSVEDDLLGDEKYEAAAIYAANSPKGVLRNSETLDSFKNVKHSSGLKSPLLTYCEILLSTVADATMRPSKADSVECVQCALEHGKIDLVAHWLATDVLECSASLGALIEKHAAETDDPRQLRLMYSLASTAYTRAEYYKQAAVAMCRQGRYYGMLSFARETRSFKSEDYLAVLRAVPHLKLGLLLVDCPSLPVKEVFGVFQLETRRDFIRALANKKDLMDLMQKDSKTSLSDWMTIVSACEEENQWDEVT